MYYSKNNDKIPLGVVTCILEILTLTAIATFVKFLSPNVSIITILFFRYVFCLPILFTVGLSQRGKFFLHINKKKTLIARIIIGITGLTSYFIAISLIGIGKTIALGQLVTIFITIMAPIMLYEKVELKRWFAVIFGLLGSIIIIDPEKSGWLNFGIFWGLNSAFFAALLNIYLRKLGNYDEPISTALWYNISGAIILTLAFIISREEIPQNLSTLSILICCGLLSSIQQFLLAFSRSLAPAVILAPFQYLSIPFAYIVGIYIFDEDLGLNFIIGTLIIILATFYLNLKTKLN
jgi:drug/metabolite transporter (DMT)-like permease|tara:strand:- start:601 stop:1479 length:879 start_codon:yes stop_codon:yes gene_type:complete